jgi:hypothetical protein
LENTIRAPTYVFIVMPMPRATLYTQISSFIKGILTHLPFEGEDNSFP